MTARMIVAYTLLGGAGIVAYAVPLARRATPPVALRRLSVRPPVPLNALRFTPPHPCPCPILSVPFRRLSRCLPTFLKKKL